MIDSGVGRDATALHWSSESGAHYTATRHRVSAPVPTKVSQLTNDAGYMTGYDVTAAIREQSLGGIWDEELQVWWTPVMRNGSLTYQATTNVNLNAEN